MADESAMQALIFHEIGHIWHKPTGISIPRLGQRGENHWLSSIKRDLPWSANIFYAKMTDTIIKIKTAGSIGKENEAEIKREYLRTRRQKYQHAGFLRDWCSYKNHSDVGYYLGCEFVKHLQRQYSLVDIASLNVNQLYNHFKEFASVE